MSNKKGGFIAPKPQGSKPVTYIGMFPKVWVPEAGVWVAQGETVEVDGEIANRLCEQKINWQAAKPPTTKPPADEPAADENGADEPDPEAEGPEEETK
jgi:hypothetical protein